MPRKAITRAFKKAFSKAIKRAFKRQPVTEGQKSTRKAIKIAFQEATLQRRTV